MKKILNLFLMAITIFALASCVDSGSTTSSFEITSYPKTTYVLGDSFSWEGLEIKVDSTTYSVANSDFTSYVTNWDNIKEPSTATAGTFTVKLTCSNGLSASFQYTVIDSYFANGNGTSTAPYQISTFVQLETALNNTESAVKDTSNQRTYYVLVNDIDCNGQLTGDGNNRLTKTTENVVIDGQGYSLKNMNGILGKQLSNSTIKNVNFYFKLDADGEYTLYKHGAIFNYLSGNVVFENINTYGTVNFTDSNASIYGMIGSAKESDKDGENIIVLKNCNNYASLTNIGSYSAVFTSGTENGKEKDTEAIYSSTNSVWYVLNCKNYGTLIATYAGLLNPNYAKLNKCIYVVDENVQNYGTLVSLLAETKGDASQIFSATDLSKFGTDKKSSLLCARYGDDSIMSSVASHYFKYNSENFYAEGKYVSAEKIASNNNGEITTNSEFADAKFTVSDYANMDKATIQTRDKLTYKLSITRDSSNKIVFACETTGSAPASFTITFAGNSVKHNASGVRMSPISSNSTFAIIKDIDSIEVANSLSLIWKSDISVKNKKTWSETAFKECESGVSLKEVSGSNHLFMSESGYVIDQTADNKYATASKINYITIIAYDSEGKVCGGYSVEWNSITK